MKGWSETLRRAKDVGDVDPLGPLGNQSGTQRPLFRLAGNGMMGYWNVS